MDSRKCWRRLACTVRKAQNWAAHRRWRKRARPPRPQSPWPAASYRYLNRGKHEELAQWVHDPQRHGAGSTCAGGASAALHQAGTAPGSGLGSLPPAARQHLATGSCSPLTGGAHQQHALGDAGAHCGEALGLLQELHNLGQARGWSAAMKRGPAAVEPAYDSSSLPRFVLPKQVMLAQKLPHCLAPCWAVSTTVTQPSQHPASHSWQAANNQAPTSWKSCLASSTPATSEKVTPAQGAVCARAGCVKRLPVHGWSSRPWRRRLPQPTLARGPR